MLKCIQKFLMKEDMGFWLISAFIFSIAAAGSSFTEGVSISLAGIELNKTFSATLTGLVVFVVVSSVPVMGCFLNRKLSRKLDLH